MPYNNSTNYNYKLFANNLYHKYVYIKGKCLT